MIRFTAGLAILLFSCIVGIYQYTRMSSDYAEREAALYDAEDKRDQGKNIQDRINAVRKLSLINNDAQKFNIERLLDIGAPRLEWRFQGQPLIRGNRALYRYTFRVMGPSTHAEGQELLARMNSLPGFVPYRYCLNCTAVPRATPEDLRMVQIEGYLYAYDPGTLF
jgi:hypothetical protein